jgi:serine O-acetyltransferase
LFAPDFWATAIYRVAHALWGAASVPVLRGPVHVACSAMRTLSELLVGVSLPAETEIGEGLYIGHCGPTVVNGRCRIGSNCNLSYGVTIGVAGRRGARAAPTIGNRVYVGPNAVLIGGIRVGDDAAIGAGAVVTNDVPARAVVVGNPARGFPSRQFRLCHV